MSVALRIAAVLATLTLAYLIGGLILLVIASPVIGVAFSKPIIEFWGWYLRWARRRAYEGDDRVFRFGYHEVRTVMWHGGPWFMASEVCNALGHENVEEATRHFPPTECASIPGRSEFWLSDAGVEKLARRSRHPRAREFRLWFEREVMHPFRRVRVREEASSPYIRRDP